MSSEALIICSVHHDYLIQMAALTGNLYVSSIEKGLQLYLFTWQNGIEQGRKKNENFCLQRIKQDHHATLFKWQHREHRSSLDKLP